MTPVPPAVGVGGGGGRPLCSLLPQGVVLAGLANTFISYNIVNISLSLEVMRHLYADAGEEVSLCATALLVGMIGGQLLFGALGDCLGRERALTYALLVCVAGAAGSAVLTSPSPALGADIYLQLTLWRFITGTGAGGVYPLMSVIAKEAVAAANASALSDADTDDEEEGGGGGKGRARRRYAARRPGALSESTAVAMTFSMQGWGYLLSPLAMLTLLKCVPSATNVHGDPMPLLWRLHLGLGALPLAAVAVMAWRQAAARPHVHPPLRPRTHRIVESAVQQAAEEDEFAVTTAAADGGTPNGAAAADGTAVPAHRSSAGGRRHGAAADDDAVLLNGGGASAGRAGGGGAGGMAELWREARTRPGLARCLAGTALPWLLFDVMFYGNNLFVPQVLEAVMGTGGGDSPTADPGDAIRLAARGDLLLKAIALPGYLAAIAAMDRVGARALQLLGLSAMAAAYAAIGALFDALPRHPRAALSLYAATFLFSNLGPNSTTFVLAGALYPPRMRASAAGVSGAAGKAGAILGGLAFEPLARSAGVAAVLLACAGVAMAALVLTAVLVPGAPLLGDGGGGGGGSVSPAGYDGSDSPGGVLLSPMPRRRAPARRAAGLVAMSRALASSLLPSRLYSRLGARDDDEECASADGDSALSLSRRSRGRALLERRGGSGVWGGQEGDVDGDGRDRYEPALQMSPLPAAKDPVNYAQL